MMMRARPASVVCVSAGVGRQRQFARLQITRKLNVQSKGTDDEEALVEDDSVPSSRSFSTTVSFLRNRFTEALAAVAASRLKEDDTEQEELRQKWLSSRAASGVTADPQSILVEQGNDDYAKLELTRPGFSFSAAGLLFPYHLGVGKCLIERGYITERTPLSGSSAGALVCAVIASGLSMEDAMLATKELASDCRKNGTAFRLGVSC
ncbi:hypothetical protein L7F22_054410 [Adiantum nelumboides]|nr:hypothetical protein [Adiantum nelumboides]